MNAGRIFLGLMLGAVGGVLLLCEPSEALAGMDWLLVLVVSKLAGVACLWGAWRLCRELVEGMSHDVQ